MEARALALLGAMPLNQMAARVLRRRSASQPRLLAPGRGARGRLSRLRSPASGSRSSSRASAWPRAPATVEDRCRRPTALEPASPERYRALWSCCRVILGPQAGGARAAASTDFRAGEPQPAALALPAPARLARGDPDTLGQVDRKALEADVETSRRAWPRPATPRAPLARSLQATLEIQSKRLENLSRAPEPRGHRRRAGADRAAGPPDSRGDRGVRRARGPLGPARRRLQTLTRPRAGWTSTRRSSPTCP